MGTSVLSAVRPGVELISAFVAASSLAFDAFGIRQLQLPQGQNLEIAWQWIAMVSFIVFLFLVYWRIWEQHHQISRWRQREHNLAQLGNLLLEVRELQDQTMACSLSDHAPIQALLKRVSSYCELELGVDYFARFQETSNLRLILGERSVGAILKSKSPQQRGAWLVLENAARHLLNFIGELRSAPLRGFRGQHQMPSLIA